MKTRSHNYLSVLRKKAENKLREKKMRGKQLSMDLLRIDLYKLNHELLIQQIELEMQNDELVKTSEKAVGMLEKYIDLYNLAPTGYITLTKEGEIVEANYSAHNLLEIKETKLVGNRFVCFVTKGSKPVFNQFIEDVINSKENKTCVISLDIHNDQNVHVLLTGHTTRNGEYCLIAIVDISDLVANDKKSNN